MADLFTLGVFARGEIVEEMFFSIIRFEPGFTSNKPTRHLLDYGNFNEHHKSAKKYSFHISL